MEFATNENQKKSLAITTALFALFLLVLFFIKFTDITIIPELEGGGGGGDVAVNFGDSDFGSGDNYDSRETVTAASRPTPQPRAAQEEIIVSDNNEAPSVANIKKPADKPKKEVEKPVEKPVQRPDKKTNDALSNILNGNSKGGDGDDDRAGNKGKSTGNTGDRGYDGGGGSGTGSGGGNGSGQGIGTGSGYGSGSGSGSGSGNGNYQLAGRKVISKPAPRYTCNEEGVVAVEIKVNSSGVVISANPGIRGTTNAAQCLGEQAKQAALNTKFDANPGAPNQTGKIIYNFKLTD